MPKHHSNLLIAIKNVDNQILTKYYNFSYKLVINISNIDLFWIVIILFPGHFKIQKILIDTYCNTPTRNF